MHTYLQVAAYMLALQTFPFAHIQVYSSSVHIHAGAAWLPRAKDIQSLALCNGSAMYEAQPALCMLLIPVKIRAGSAAFEPFIGMHIGLSDVRVTSVLMRRSFPCTEVPRCASQIATTL